jgi:hypothetical protein
LTNLSELVHTVLVSLPSLVYVVELLVIWLIEFAMIFYQSFPYVNYGTCINKDVNFERFLPSFIFSFQVINIYFLLHEILYNIIKKKIMQEKISFIYIYKYSNIFKF